MAKSAWTNYKGNRETNSFPGFCEATEEHKDPEDGQWIAQKYCNKNKCTLLWQATGLDVPHIGAVM